MREMRSLPQMTRMPATLLLSAGTTSLTEEKPVRREKAARKSLDTDAYRRQNDLKQMATPPTGRVTR